ncbi:MAG: hypothetical protein JNJ71_00940 [Rubrivivax sp.]|nr:hypothetical protein [Rubrivivax sp.]
MSWLRAFLQSLLSASFIALVAPPIAAGLAVLMMVSLSGWASISLPGPGDLLLGALGVAIGGYVLGGLPAFAAGLALPLLRRHLPRAAACLATGVLGMTAYLLSFGQPWLVWPLNLRNLSTFGLPALASVTLAAWLFTRPGRGN